MTGDAGDGIVGGLHTAQGVKAPTAISAGILVKRHDVPPRCSISLIVFAEKKGVNIGVGSSYCWGFDLAWILHTHCYGFSYAGCSQ
jgi:hypothetical protein